MRVGACIAPTHSVNQKKRNVEYYFTKKGEKMSQKNIQEAAETIVVNNPLVIKQNADSKTVDFYLTGEVSWVSEYIDFLRAIDDCKPGDQIHIHINNYGGYIDTALNIYDALVFL